MLPQFQVAGSRVLGGHTPVPTCPEAPSPGRGRPVYCEMDGGPVKQSAELSEQPIQIAGERATGNEK